MHDHGVKRVCNGQCGDDTVKDVHNSPPFEMRNYTGLSLVLAEKSVGNFRRG
jgi:hypothetical protein